MFISDLFEQILNDSQGANEAKGYIKEYASNIDNYVDLYSEVCEVYRRSKEDFFKLSHALCDIYNDCFVFDFFRIGSTYDANDMEGCQEAIHQISARYLFAGLEDFCTGDYHDAVSSLDRILHCFELSENKRLFIEMKLAEVQLINCNLESFSIFADLLPVVGDYTAKTIDFYNLYFKDYAFYGDLELLPSRARYAGFMAAFLSEATDGNEEDAFGLLKEMLKSYKDMEQVTLKLTELYGNFVAKTR